MDGRGDIGAPAHGLCTDILCSPNLETYRWRIMKGLTSVFR